VVSYLEDSYIPALIGEEPDNMEDIRHNFYKGAYWERGPVTMTAMSAIDMALWDIKAKKLNAPPYSLSGGKSRDRVLVYDHASGKEMNESIERTGKLIDEGCLVVRVQSGIPGVPHAYGVTKEEKRYEPAGKGIPFEEQRST